MSTVATYSFLPWLRQGVANTITSADGDPAVKTRASVHVELQLSGDPVGGGGALDADARRRTSRSTGPATSSASTRARSSAPSRDTWITNFESNYLPHGRVLRRGLPVALHAGRARREPAPPAPVDRARRARRRASSRRAGPSAAVRCRSSPSPDAQVFPPPDELWAWAHVHFNQSLSSGAERARLARHGRGAAARRRRSSRRTATLAYSRLVCPRRLDDNTDYHAFVVPTFETGRLAGLGQDPAGAPNATASAWEPYAGRPEPTSYPVYYRWFFRTGSQRRLRVSGPAAQAAAGRHAGRARATWTCRIRRRTSRGSPTPTSAASCGSAARLRVPDADLDDADLRRAAEVRELGPAVPAPVPARARRVRQPGRRLRGAGGCRRQRGERLPASPTIPTR